MSPFAAVLEYVSGLVRMEGCITMSLRPKTEEEMIPACATFHVFDPCMGSACENARFAFHGYP